MTRQAIIDKTVQIINRLPQEKASEISDFADFVSTKYEEQQMTENIQKMVSDSQSFSFLKNEEDIYSLDELKEKYND